MPNYDFKCNACSNIFQINVKISEKDNVKCPNCNGANIQQVYSSSIGVKIDSNKPCESGCASGGG